jgi:hypothetical protein
MSAVPAAPATEELTITLPRELAELRAHHSKGRLNPLRPAHV